MTQVNLAVRVGLSTLVVAAVAWLSPSLTALGEDPANGEVVQVEAKYVFAPVGFDDNDDVTVVVDGYLPSGCYRQMRPIVDVDPETRLVKITTQARFFDIPCVQALVPYWFEVRLGALAEGRYKITVNDGAVGETLDVAESSNAGPDDFLYAAIDAVTVDRQEGSGDLIAKIEGRFTNSCMVLEELRLIDNGKTINLLPIMKMQDEETCEATETDFRRMVTLPASLTAGRHLLHVRSLNGKAVNYLFSK